MFAMLGDNFFNPVIAARYFPAILKGLLVTLQLGVLVAVTGVALGLALAFLRAFQIRPLSLLIVAFADVLRTLPPLVVLILLYFALPFAGLQLSGFAATWLALSMALAAFAEESFWGGILSVHRGQWEAGRSTGLSYTQTLWHIVLPQALRLAIPPLTNRTIAITKMTAIASVVSVEEILANASTAQAYSANTTPLTMAAIAYLAMFLPLVVFSRWFERRYAWKR